MNPKNEEKLKVYIGKFNDQIVLLCRRKPFEDKDENKDDIKEDGSNDEKYKMADEDGRDKYDGNHRENITLI